METTPIYSLLDPSARQIRILTLDPAGDEPQTVRCQLSTQSLNDSKSDFVALSYVWDTDGMRETVSLWPPKPRCLDF
jgi:hypothetical protein